MGLTIKAMHEIFSKLQFHTCKLQFWHRLSLFIIDSLKIVSPKLIVTLSFCLFAEDQSRNLHHKFFKFQNKQARNLVKKKQTRNLSRFRESDLKMSKEDTEAKKRPASPIENKGQKISKAIFLAFNSSSKRSKNSKNIDS